VRSMAAGGSGLKVRHDGGTITAGFAVACAGAGADRLAIASGAPKDPRIVPFRGAYLELRPTRARLVRANIYPVPDPELPFLGAHLTRTFDGRVLLGPTALMAGGWTWPGAWRVAWRHRRAAVREIHHAASRTAFVAEAERLVPDLEPPDFVRGPHGTRAQAVTRDGTLIDDFVVHETERAIHVRNAPSPAATSSLALAREVVDRAEGLG
jgi:L-2-hydroxyglutarate oxidase